MGKANKYAKQAAALVKHNSGSTPTARKQAVVAEIIKINYLPLKVGNHQFRIMDDSLSGARITDYPPEESIPTDFKRDSNIWNKRASSWFFSGGSLSALGIDYNTPPNINSRDYWVSVKTAVQMLLQSFEPSHEHKIATVAWCMSEWFKEI